MSFRDDRTKAATAKMTAHLWNETKRTRPIATLSYLDKGIVARSGEHAWRRFVVEIGRALIAKWNDRQGASIYIRITDCEDLVNLAGPDECIDFRHFSLELIAIAFYQTAGNDQTLGLALGL